MKATQQGAEAYEPTQEDERAVEEAQQQRLNDKNEEMTEIAARHRETRDKELAEAGHEVQDTTQEVVEIEDPNEEPEEEQPEEKAEEQVEEKAEEQEEPDEFETLIVDGQETPAAGRYINKRQPTNDSLRQARNYARPSKNWPGPASYPARMLTLHYPTLRT